MRIELNQEADTQALGERLSRVLCARGHGVVYLHGDLGAGKTTLARAFLRHAGVAGTLRSPTYTLMEPYTAGALRFLHLDLYRLASADEVENLGLRDYPPETTIWLVEWPERGAGHLPRPDWTLHLGHLGDGRVAQVEAADAEALQALGRA